MSNMSSQRPFFLSSFLAAFRQQNPSTLSSQQPNKHTSQSASASSYAAASTAPRGIAAAAASGTQARTAGAMVNQLPLHSPRGAGIPIPSNSANRRRGSDSSSEGFRDVLGAEKWYIGGRTAGGDEKFFKLGVVKRVKSNDRLSIDRLSL